MGVAIAAAALALSASNAAAATITVTTTADGYLGPGQCTLREAIYDVDYPGTAAGTYNNACAPAAFGDNTIVLGPHTYRLDQSYPLAGGRSGGSMAIGPMRGVVTIAGAGEGRTSIDASALDDRIFVIDSGAAVAINDLTLTGGHAMTGDFGPAAQVAEDGANGGAVLNLGSLTLNDVAVSANAAGDGGLGGTGTRRFPAGGSGGHGGSGGGIYNTGSLTLNRVTVGFNHAGDGGMSGDGGSPDSGSGGPGGNGGSGGNGGAVASAGGTLTIVGSTIFGNIAGNGRNGGQGGDATTSGNGGNGGSGGAGGGGGGISVTGGTLSVTNSTFVSNLGGVAGRGGSGGSGAGTGGAGGNGGSGGSGGSGGAASLATAATGTLLHVSVASNAAGPSAPGPTSDSDPPNGGAGGSGSPNGSPGADGSSGTSGGVSAASGMVTVRNSLLASNLRGNCSGSVLDGGRNLSFNGSGCPVTFAGGNPQLGPLQDHGGPAPTLSLGRGSAAIDQIPARGAECPSTDERGVRRPGGRACDIGAYEVASPVVSAVTARATGPRAGNILVTVTANAARATAWVQYGRTKSYGRESRVTNVSGVTPATAGIVVRPLDLRRTYHFRVVVSSMDGATQTRDITLAVPILGRLKATPAKFGAAGTSLKYTDSRRAVTTFTVQRRARGRWITVGSFRHRDRRGPNRVHWNGLPRGHKLRPGIYRLEASPRFGLATGLTRRVRFTIVP